MTLHQIYDYAKKADDELSGLNGDPAKAASWIRERKLARIVVELTTRIVNASLDVDVPR